MTSHQERALLGIFSNQSFAEQAIRELRVVGFREDQIGLLAHASATGVGGEAAQAIAVNGDPLGIQWPMHIGIVVVPAIGSVVAGGMVASRLTNISDKATTGAIVEALTDAGLSLQEAKDYEKEFNARNTLIIIHPRGRVDEALAILRGNGGNVRTDW